MGRNALFADLRALDNLGLAATGTPVTLVASDHATVTQHTPPFAYEGARLTDEEMAETEALVAAIDAAAALAYDEPFADDDDDPDAQVAAYRADLINERIARDERRGIIERDEAASAYESYIARLADADDRGWSRRMDSLERKMILAEQRGDRVAFLGMMNRLARGDV